MRVITGTARGRRLRTPENYDIRPTTDNVKESVFNIIQFDIEGRRVLDLFAGTGQLGIECLSRGAAEAVFIDEPVSAGDISRRSAAGDMHLPAQLHEAADIRQVKAHYVRKRRRGDQYLHTFCSSRRRFFSEFIMPPNTVIKIIFMSSRIDQFSMYHRSYSMRRSMLVSPR